MITSKTHTDFQIHSKKASKSQKGSPGTGGITSRLSAVFELSSVTRLVRKKVFGFEVDSDSNDDHKQIEN